MADFDYASWVRRAVAFVSTLPERVSSEVSVSLHVVSPPQLDETLPDDFVQNLGSARYESALRSLPTPLHSLYSEAATEIKTVYSLKVGGKRLYGGPLWVSPERILELGGNGFFQTESNAIAPFMELENGDFIALASESDRSEVFYLSHEESPFVLANSLPEFLTEWERCCYIGPESWMLEEHAGLVKGKALSGGTEAAQSLRKLLGVEG